MYYGSVDPHRRPSSWSNSQQIFATYHGKAKLLFDNMSRPSDAQRHKWSVKWPGIVLRSSEITTRASVSAADKQIGVQRPTRRGTGIPDLEDIHVPAPPVAALWPDKAGGSSSMRKLRLTHSGRPPPDVRASLEPRPLWNTVAFLQIFLVICLRDCSAPPRYSRLHSALLCR